MSVKSVLFDRTRANEREPAAAGAKRLQRRRRARRGLRVNALRLLVGVVWIGTWELTTRVGLVDKFFFGQPSGIADRMWTWLSQGTALGPLWEQVAVTMQETVLGFLV